MVTNPLSNFNIDDETFGVPENWFESWFDNWYLKVYPHRDQKEAERFVSSLPAWDRIDAHGWCLDVGCGEGRFAREIVARGMKVAAVDLSQTLLDTAKTLARGDQPDITLSDQIHIAEALIEKLFCHADDKPQIFVDQFVESGLVTGADAARHVKFLFPGPPFVVAYCLQVML